MQNKDGNMGLNIFEKYNIIMEYCFYGLPRRPLARQKDSKGRPVGKYMLEFRHSYNKGKLALPQDMIDKLKEKGILTRTPQEYEQMSKELNIPANKLKKIERDFRSIEYFIKITKNSSMLHSNYWANNYGIKNQNITILSSCDLTARDKGAYVRLIKHFYPQIEKNPKDFFLNKEAIDRKLSELSEQLQLLVNRIFGFDDCDSIYINTLSKKINIPIPEINKMLKEVKSTLETGIPPFYKLTELKEELLRLEKVNADGQYIEQLRSLIAECEKAQERYLQNENIFDDNEIVQASGKSHLDFCIMKQATLQDKKEAKQEKEKKVCDLQAQIDVQDIKEQKLIEILDIKEKDKTQEFYK